MVRRIFDNRSDAGKALVEEVRRCDLQRPLILGLPRGGVPVAFEIARALRAPLDILIVRKLGTPFQRELAFGAIATGGITVLNHDIVPLIEGLTDDVIDDIVARETAELVRRERLYRGNRPTRDLSGRNIVLVDDGLATGATMRVAVEAIKPRTPASITVAVPVGSRSALQALTPMVDRLICLVSPAGFRAVGEHYVEFPQLTDEEVTRFLIRARQEWEPDEVDDRN